MSDQISGHSVAQSSWYIKLTIATGVCFVVLWVTHIIYIYEWYALNAKILSWCHLTKERWWTQNTFWNTGMNRKEEDGEEAWEEGSLESKCALKPKVVSWGRDPAYFLKFSPSWFTGGKFTCMMLSPGIWWICLDWNSSNCHIKHWEVSATVHCRCQLCCEWYYSAWLDFLPSTSRMCPQASWIFRRENDSDIRQSWIRRHKQPLWKT